MDDNTKLSNLEYYRELGWPLIPLHWINEEGVCSCKEGAKCTKSAGKHPLINDWQHKATTNAQTIKDWHRKWPQANWGVKTGSKETGGAGVVVVDIDPRNGGDLTWDNLRTEHPEPLETVLIKTGGGGWHHYFLYPNSGRVITCKGGLWPGVDVKADDGYVIIPPSFTKGKYTFQLSPEDTELEELPGWIIEKYNPEPEPKEPIKILQMDPESLADKQARAITALNALHKERADSYEKWIEVGMSLYELDQVGLELWDNWSKQSPKYEPGACNKKWLTFTPALQDASKISFASLIYWAQEDGGMSFVSNAPRGAKPSHYIKALEGMGYSFSVNTMNDMLYANGSRLSDLLMSKIMTGLRQYEYKAKDVAMDTIATLALENQFHPVKDYLESLTWDGQDHIATLSIYFKDKDDLFYEVLKHWLIGAVGKIIGPRPGQQHPMLVLDGPQGIGKSRFVWWLGSPLPGFYIQNSINTMDKDFLILLCSKWVWEVEELGATLRKSDIESLKAFLSKEIINVRKPYGRDEIVKPATASFIGTINSSGGGFLADPTGHRRFRVINLQAIAWEYDKVIDINQVWAQAVALLKAGETWELEKPAQEKINEINSRYEVDDPLLYDILNTFKIEPDLKGLYLSTAQIIHTLRNNGAIVGGSDQQIAQRIANIVQKLGCENGRVRIDGRQVRAWLGVSLK
jgi:hypothetical protein